MTREHLVLEGSGGEVTCGELTPADMVMLPRAHWGSLLRVFSGLCRKTYPILSFYQQIKGVRIPFPVYVLGHTDAAILRVDLECWGCFIALESIIQRILD